MADINDVRREHRDLFNKRNTLANQRHNYLQGIVKENRALTADELTQDEKYGADLGKLDVELRAKGAELGVLENELAAKEQAAKEAEERNFKGEDKPEKGVQKKDRFDSPEYKAEFRRWMQGEISDRDIDNYVRSMPTPEYRALGRDVATQGAPVVPREHLRRLVELLENTSMLMKTIGTELIDGDKEFAIETARGTAVYRDPGEAYGGTDPALDLAPVTICDLGRIVTVDEELLADAVIDIEGYLMRNFAIVFSDTIENQVINGISAKGPLGLDGLIAIAGLQAATTTAIGVVDFADLIRLRSEVPVSGRAGGMWLMSPATEAALMLLVDGNDRPLWQESPSYESGSPGRILGQPYILSDWMPDIGLGNVAVLYGNFGLYITNFIRQSFLMRRLVERYAELGRVGFRGSLRHDVVVTQPDGIARLTVKAA